MRNYTVNVIGYTGASSKETAVASILSSIPSSNNIKTVSAEVCNKGIAYSEYRVTIVIKDILAESEPKVLMIVRQILGLDLYWNLFIA